jgi:hypothetical protein
MARPVRVELTTYSFGGCRSIHLSYGRTLAITRRQRNALTIKLPLASSF